ncbi:MAG: glutathione S-transferase family protein [Caulobacterales bacterium]
MTGPYRLYGAELSPYSQKVRSYLAYAGTSFEWVNRANARQEEIQRYAKLPLLPILVGADDEAKQDSTPIIEFLESENPKLTPDDAAIGFLAALLEDYADEWLNKAMFHYRWTKDVDQQSAAERLVAGMFEGEDPPNRDTLVAAVRERMANRLRHVGSTADTGPIIEASFERFLGFLETLLEGRSYLFGARPSIADFGIAAQLDQMLSDPTPGALMRERAPRVIVWVRRMKDAKNEGAFDTFDAVSPSFAPLLQSELAITYLPWGAANADGVARDASNVSVSIGDKRFAQAPQRYAAKAFAELQRKYAAADSAALTSFLESAGCASFLASSGLLSSGVTASDDDESDDDEE